MSDIVERLRRVNIDAQTADEAADEIERLNTAIYNQHLNLTAEVERLTEAELLRATETVELDRRVHQLEVDNERLRREMRDVAGYTTDPRARDMLRKALEEPLCGCEQPSLLRLRRIEQAASRAFDYHMLGYGNAEPDWEASTMLDLMNELGKALEEGEMSDIVERLRRVNIDAQTADEAADEIEQLNTAIYNQHLNLTAEVERLNEKIGHLLDQMDKDGTEIERLTKERDNFQAGLVTAVARIAELEDPHYVKGLQAENERLRAENEQLKGWLDGNWEL